MLCRCCPKTAECAWFAHSPYSGPSFTVGPCSSMPSSWMTRVISSTSCRSCPRAWLLTQSRIASRSFRYCTSRRSWSSSSSLVIVISCCRCVLNACSVQSALRARRNRGSSTQPLSMTTPIDRAALVRRHNPRFTEPHPADVLTVGNGNVAMTVDCSGLQTFPAFHELATEPMFAAMFSGDLRFDKDQIEIPVRTQASWGWYATRGSREYSMAEAETVYETRRASRPYAEGMGIAIPGQDIPAEDEAAAWLASNPRRLHLGRLALYTSADLPALTGPDQLEAPVVALDLWAGVVESRFRLAGEPVVVTAAAHPDDDILTVRVVSPLLARGLAVTWVFDEQPDPIHTF